MDGISCLQTIKHVDKMGTDVWDDLFTNNEARR